MLEIKQVECFDCGLIWLGIDPADEHFAYAGEDAKGNPCPIESAVGFHRYSQHVVNGRVRYLRRRELLNRDLLVQMGLVAAVVLPLVKYAPYKPPRRMPLFR